MILIPGGAHPPVTSSGRLPEELPRERSPDPRRGAGQHPGARGKCAEHAKDG